MTAPAPTVTNELKTLLRAVKLGRCLDTLPERLALAKTRNLSHHEFLELVLADEVTRRETSSASLRAPGRRTRPRHDPGELGRHHQGQLRPPGLRRALLPALHRRRPQRPDPRPRRSWLTLRFLSSGCVEQSSVGGVYLDA